MSHEFKHVPLGLRKYGGKHLMHLCEFNLHSAQLDEHISHVIVEKLE